MAIRVNDELVRTTVKAVSSRSPILGKKIREAQATVRKNPSFYEELDFLPPFIDERRPRATIRKIYITHGRHNYRLLYLHQTLSTGDEVVDYWYLRDRKKGAYTPDPQEIRHLLIDE